MLCLIWLVLGFSLSFHKAQHGHQVVWVGYQLTSHGDCVTAAINQSFMDSLRQTTDDILKKNVIGHRKLKSYTGCANHVANLLFAWRPFLDTLWAASAGATSQQGPNTKKRRWALQHKKSRSPRGTVWVKQVRTSLLWILSFLSLHQGPLSRTWDLHDFYNISLILTLVLDASPWGLGGVLFEGDSPVASFSSMLTKDDEKIHHHRVGEHEGQQLWGCLSVLVALKAWLHFWSQRRLSVAIQSDNLSALYMAARMKSKASPLTNKEIALNLFQGFLRTTLCGTHPRDRKQPSRWSQQAERT